MERTFLDSLIGKSNKSAELMVKAKGLVPLLIEQGKFLPDVIRPRTVILTFRNNKITFAESGEDD